MLWKNSHPHQIRLAWNWAKKAIGKWVRISCAMDRERWLLLWRFRFVCALIDFVNVAECRCQSKLWPKHQFDTRNTHNSRMQYKLNTLRSEARRTMQPNNTRICTFRINLIVKQRLCECYFLMAHVVGLCWANSLSLNVQNMNAPKMDGSCWMRPM